MTRPNYVLAAAWEECLLDWLDWLRLGGMSANTIRLRREHLRAVARRLDAEHPRDVTFADLVALCRDRQWGNEYRRGVRSSLISFFDWCVDNGKTEHNPAALMPKVSGSSANPRPAPDEVWSHLMATAKPGAVLLRRRLDTVHNSVDNVRQLDHYVVGDTRRRAQVVDYADQISQDGRGLSVMCLQHDDCQCDLRENRIGVPGLVLWFQYDSPNPVQQLRADGHFHRVDVLQRQAGQRFHPGGSPIPRVHRDDGTLHRGWEPTNTCVSAVTTLR